MQRAFYQPSNGGNDKDLPSWTYYAMAMVFATIGAFLAKANIAYFLVAIQAHQPDPEIRKILGSAAILFVLAEIAAFTAVGLLPRQKLRELRMRLMLCGVLLLALEIVSIYAAQATIAKTASASAAARTARIAQLEASIASQRAAAAGLRENATRQTESKHSWIRQGAADSLRDAIAVERSIAPMSSELAELQAARRPTLDDVFGEDGTIGLNFAMSVALTTFGLVMFGSAGALIRAGRDNHPPLVPAGGDGGQPAPAPVQPPAPSSTSTSNTAASNTAPRARRARKGTRPRVGGNVVAFPAASSSAVSAEARAETSTVVSPDSSASALDEETVLVEARCARESKGARRARGRAQRARELSTVPDGRKLDTGVEGESGHRYRRVRDGVMSGDIKPSVRAIQNAVGGGTLVARRYLQALADEGVIGRAGQGYELARGRIAA